MNYLPIILLSCAFVSGSLSADELDRLDKAYEKKVEQVLKPVNQRYLKALEALKAKAMKNQDLALANKVDVKIKEFKKNPKPRSFQVLPKKVPSTEWHWHASGGSQFSLVFMKDGKAARLRDGKKDKNWLWTVAKDDKSVELDTGDAKYKVTFDRRFRVATRLKLGSNKPTKMQRLNP